MLPAQAATMGRHEDLRHLCLAPIPNPEPHFSQLLHAERKIDLSLFLSPSLSLSDSLSLTMTRVMMSMVIMMAKEEEEKEEEEVA